MDSDKKKIKREKPNKKWTDGEICKILSYLQESNEIEAPTAQIYYKKMIERTGVDASWDLVKWKVRHLKSTFKRASDWRSSTGAGLLEADEGTSTVEGKILQMCPYFHQLSAIFGEKTRGRSAMKVIDSGDLSTMDVSIDADANDMAVNAEYLEDDGLLLENNYLYVAIDEGSSPEDVPPVEVPEYLSIHTASHGKEVPECSSAAQTSKCVSKKAHDFAEKIKKFAPKSSASYLAAFQAERTAMFNMKWEFEKQKHKDEAAYNERKLKLEEEKFKADVDFKNKEIELRQLEMEKDERLKRFEIEMKFKYEKKP